MFKNIFTPEVIASIQKGVENQRLTTDRAARLEADLEAERTRRVESQTRIEAEIALLSQELQVERGESSRLRAALDRSDEVCTEITTEREQLTDENTRLRSELEERKKEHREELTERGRLMGENVRLQREWDERKNEHREELIERGRLMGENVCLQRELDERKKEHREELTERVRLMGENVRLQSEMEERKKEHREELARACHDLGNERVLRATEVARLTKALEDERRVREEEILDADGVRVVQRTTEARVVPLDETPITYKELRHLAASLQDDRSQRMEDIVQIQKLLEGERNRFTKEIAQLTARASSSIHRTTARHESRWSKSTVELAYPM